jgi:hypothetical protein
MTFICFHDNLTQSSKKTTSYTDAEDKTSLLIFNGDEAIYRLYDFLYKYQYQEEPPTLYSPIAFTHGSLKQIQIKANGMCTFRKKTKKKLGKRVRQGGKTTELEQVFSLELNGIFFPTHIAQLCQMFNITQKKNFSTSFQILKNTTGFNYRPESEENVMGIRGIKKMNCVDGTYNLKIVS